MINVKVTGTISFLYSGLKPLILTYLLVIGSWGVAQTASSEPVGGQIVVNNDHPRWFKYHNNGPHFLAGPGDPEDFLYRGDRLPDGTRDGDQDALIAKLAESGANSIYMQIIRSNGGDGDSSHNPFIDNNPSNGLEQAVLDQWQSWFETMDQHGIVTYLFFYDDSALVWDTGDVVASQERAFIQQIVARFKHIKHLVWVVAEEYSEAFSATRVSRIAAEIRAADNFQHPIAVHKLTGTSFSEFADDPNIDQFAIQLAAGDPDMIHDWVLEANTHSQGRYSLNMSESPNWGSGAIARQKAWASAMAGASVMVLAMSIDKTPASDLEDLGRLRTFMESTALELMAPNDELAMGSTDYVLAAPGAAYIAYAKNATDAMGIKAVPKGTYNLRWFDPVDGDTVQMTHTADGTDVFFTIPAQLGSEAVLYLEVVGSHVTPVFPNLSWQFRSPEELGLDTDLLDQLTARVGGSGCISRYGYMGLCWGDVTGNGDWASASKPVISTLLFFAIQEGRVSGVNESISNWGWALSQADSNMTFSQLANMTSGYARGEDPGEAWAYNDFAISLYGKTMEAVYGSDLDLVAKDRMAALEFEHGSVFGSRKGLGVNASIMDFARIGLLWLRQGQWKDKQLLSSDFFIDYTRAQVAANLPLSQSEGSDYLAVGSIGGDSSQIGFGPGVYGYNWWFNNATANGSLWPTAPADTFQANGHWGQEVVIVIPSQDLVVAGKGNWGVIDDFTYGNADSRMNRNLELLSLAAGPPQAGPDRVSPLPPSNLRVE